MLDRHKLKRGYRTLRSDLKKLDPREVLALPAAVRAVLAEPISLSQAEDEVRKRLHGRAQSFLDFARTEVFEKRRNPYHRMLKSAGCDYADLEQEVQKQGVERALERLALAGVYLTSEEYKGKKPVVRGQESFSVVPEDFECHDPGPSFTIQSSGTSNRPMESRRSLDRRGKAISMGIFLAAHGLFSYAHGLYDAILPAGGGLTNLLIYAKLGIPTERWFAREVPVPWPVKWFGALTTQMIVRAAKRCPAGFPAPEVIGVNDTQRIVRWIEEKRRLGQPCCVTCAASNAARIARGAWDLGVSLEGTKFVVSGEPFTKAKKESIERVGARAASRFSSGLKINSGIGYGCANPIYDDEVHVHQHSIAVVTHPQSLFDDGAEIHPLMVTTLHRSAGKFLLNVQNGDYATFSRRDCGCALEKVGLTLHLHGIRSFEKFTSEGMNYFATDLFELLERTLPCEFGGGPGDYQLVEEEDHAGQTRLTLLVHPAVTGGFDEAKLLSRLQQGMAQGSRNNRFMSKLWQDAGTFRMLRQAPYASARGKILPLHIKR